MKSGDRLFYHLYLAKILTEQEKKEEIVLEEALDEKRRMQEQRSYESSLRMDSVEIEAYITDKKLKNVKHTPGGVFYIITKTGDGKLPKPGALITVKYVGSLTDGTIFDQTKNEPLEFTFGELMVIRGWEEGFAYLSKGAKAKLIIPSALAYRDEGKGSIPPNSILIFDLEVLDIKAPKEDFSPR